MIYPGDLTDTNLAGHFPGADETSIEGKIFGNFPREAIYPIGFLTVFHIRSCGSHLPLHISIRVFAASFPNPMRFGFGF